MSAPRLTVYVTHHRSPVAPSPEPPPYLAVCNVRPDGSRPPGFTAYDDEGGLPGSNTAYNELSVLHRLQARADTELVGLSHYRRALLARRPTGRRGEQPGTLHVRGWDWRQPERWGGDETSLVPAMHGLDWATPRPFDPAGRLPLAVGALRGQPPGGAAAPGGRGGSRAASRPRAFGVYLRRESATPLYSVFLGRRELLDRYEAFRWPVLAACAPGLELGDYPRRWAGFVAERLHGYWLAHRPALGGAGRCAAARAARRPAATAPTAAHRPPADAGVADADAGARVPGREVAGHVSPRGRCRTTTTVQMARLSEESCRC